MGAQLKHYHAARIILGAYGVNQEEFECLNDVELTQYLQTVEELETARRQKLALQFLSLLGTSRSSPQSRPTTAHQSKTRVVHSLRRRPVGEKK